VEVETPKPKPKGKGRGKAGKAGVVGILAGAALAPVFGSLRRRFEDREGIL
jgi:hypothetical protein